MVVLGSIFRSMQIKMLQYQDSRRGPPSVFIWDSYADHEKIVCSGMILSIISAIAGDCIDCPSVFRRCGRFVGHRIRVLHGLFVGNNLHTHSHGD